MKRIYSTLGLLAMMTAAVGVAGGCESTAVVPGQYDEAAVYPNITLQEGDLQQRLGFQEPIISETETGMMKVTVPVRARSSETLHVEYQVTWLDSDGAPIRPQMNWEPLRLEPRQPRYVAASASSDEAENYSLHFRWSKP